MAWTAVYELASNRFLRGGTFRPEFNPSTEGIASYPPENPPDFIAERYDGAAPSKRRPATQQELDAAAAAKNDQKTDQAMTTGLAKTIVEFTLRQVLGRVPTGPERQAAATQFRQIYRAFQD